MGRRKSIDRNLVLDVAEGIVAAEGASSLTIDAVAKRAGITKGGVQSCFATKEVLIEAMLVRWTSSYAEAFARHARDPGDGVDRVRAHVAVTRGMEDEDNARSASLLALLLQSPAHLVPVRAWYRDRVAGLEVSTPQGRQARLAFLAMEGAFLLRFFGLMDLDDEWTDIGDDIAAALPAAPPADAA